MALDPRIALAGEVMDAGQAISTGLASRDVARTQGIRELILEQQAQQQQQDIATTQGQYMNQLATGLQNLPLDQRAAAMAQQLPFLTQMGMNPAEILTQDLTNQGLQNVVIQTQPFMTPRGGAAAQKLTGVGDISLKDFTAESVQAFMDSGQKDFGALERIEKWTTTELPDGSKVQISNLSGEIRFPTAPVAEEPPEAEPLATDDLTQPVTAPPVTTLTPQQQLETRVEAESQIAGAVEEAKSDIRVQEAERIAAVQLANDAVRREVAETVKQQGQRSKLEDADIAYKALTDGNLEKIYGFGEGLFPDFMRSEEGVLLQARRDQLLGMLVMAGKGELKGQGPITDADQRIIEQSVSVLGNENISAKQARKALDEAMNILYRGAGEAFTPDTDVDTDIDNFLDSLGL